MVRIIQNLYESLEKYMEKSMFCKSLENCLTSCPKGFLFDCHANLSNDFNRLVFFRQSHLKELNFPPQSSFVIF